MATIDFTSNSFVLTSLDPILPPLLDNPGGDVVVITNPDNSGILGPIVTLPGWPDLNNIHVWNPEPFNPNLGPPPQFVIPVQLPNHLDTVVLPPLSPGPSASDLYGNFQPMAVVPEPTTVALVMMGCAAAAVSKRFRRKKH